MASIFSVAATATMLTAISANRESLDLHLEGLLRPLPYMALAVLCCASITFCLTHPELVAELFG